MAGTGIEPRSLALLVRCSTTELSRLISTVHLARTTTFLPLTKCSAPKTHTTNTSSPCQDLSNTNAWTGNATAPNVVGIGWMNKYKEIQNENIWLYRGSNPGALHHYSNALLLSYRARTTTISMWDFWNGQICHIFGRFTNLTMHVSIHMDHIQQCLKLLYIFFNQFSVLQHFIKY